MDILRFIIVTLIFVVIFPLSVLYVTARKFIEELSCFPYGIRTIWQLIFVNKVFHKDGWK